MKTLLILAAGLFLSVTADPRADHIEEVGCYDAFGKPETMINLRNDIDWPTWKDTGYLYKTINRCAEIAQEKNWLFFAVEYYGECLHIKTLEDDLTKMKKSTKCAAGVGVQNVRMIYKGKCRSVFGCCPDNKTPATGLNHKGCPVDGEWSDYSNWGDCSVSCGDGTKSRKRTCTNPAPQNGGADCAGPDTDTEPCNEGACPTPVDGGWTDWSSFEPAQCPVTCGGGVQTRTRKCTNPAPAHGGKDCEGDATEEQICNKKTCAFVCTGKKLDIVLIVDTSGSIDLATEFPFVRQFLGFFSTAFVMSNDDSQSQIASVRFGSVAEIKFNFNQYTTNPPLKAYLDTYPYVRGWTNTPAALKLAGSLFTPAQGHRQQDDVKPVTIVLTDGESMLNGIPLNAQTIAASNELKATGTPHKIHLMAVGIGDGIKLKELQDMVTDPAKDVFEMADFSDLVDRVYDVAKAVCDLGY